MKYDVIISCEWEEFVKAVNRALAGGWKLQGGVSISTINHGDDGWYTQFTQAVILENGGVK